MVIAKDDGAAGVGGTREDVTKSDVGRPVGRRASTSNRETRVHRDPTAAPSVLQPFSIFEKKTRVWGG